MMYYEDMAKQAKELAKAKEKDAKEAKKFDEKVKKVEYERKIQQMDMETMLKIMQRQEEMKKNYQKLKNCSRTKIYILFTLNYIKKFLL